MAPTNITSTEAQNIENDVKAQTPDLTGPLDKKKEIVEAIQKAVNTKKGGVVSMLDVFENIMTHVASADPNAQEVKKEVNKIIIDAIKDKVVGIEANAKTNAERIARILRGEESTTQGPWSEKPVDDEETNKKKREFKTKANPSMEDIYEALKEDGIKDEVGEQNAYAFMLAYILREASRYDQSTARFANIQPTILGASIEWKDKNRGYKDFAALEMDGVPPEKQEMSDPEKEKMELIYANAEKRMGKEIEYQKQMFKSAPYGIDVHVATIIENWKNGRSGVTEPITAEEETVFKMRLETESKTLEQWVLKEIQKDFDTAKSLEKAEDALRAAEVEKEINDKVEARYTELQQKGILAQEIWLPFTEFTIASPFPGQKDVFRKVKGFDNAQSEAFIGDKIKAKRAALKANANEGGRVQAEVLVIIKAQLNEAEDVDQNYNRMRALLKDDKDRLIAILENDGEMDDTAKWFKDEIQKELDSRTKEKKEEQDANDFEAEVKAAVASRYNPARTLAENKTDRIAEFTADPRKTTYETRKAKTLEALVDEEMAKLTLAIEAKRKADFASAEGIVNSRLNLVLAPSGTEATEAENQFKAIFETPGVLTDDQKKAVRETLGATPGDDTKIKEWLQQKIKANRDLMPTGLTLDMLEEHEVLEITKEVLKTVEEGRIQSPVPNGYLSAFPGVNAICVRLITAATTPPLTPEQKQKLRQQAESVISAVLDKYPAPDLATANTQIKDAITKCGVTTFDQLMSAIRADRTTVATALGSPKALEEIEVLFLRREIARIAIGDARWVNVEEISGAHYWKNKDIYRGWTGDTARYGEGLNPVVGVRAGVPLTTGPGSETEKYLAWKTATESAERAEAANHQAAVLAMKTHIETNVNPGDNVDAKVNEFYTAFFTVTTIINLDQRKAFFAREPGDRGNKTDGTPDEIKCKNWIKPHVEESINFKNDLKSAEDKIKEHIKTNDDKNTPLDIRVERWYEGLFGTGGKLSDAEKKAFGKKHSLLDASDKIKPDDCKAKLEEIYESMERERETQNQHLDAIFDAIIALTDADVGTTDAERDAAAERIYSGMTDLQKAAFAQANDIEADPTKRAQVLIDKDFKDGIKDLIQAVHGKRGIWQKIEAQTLMPTERDNMLNEMDKVEQVLEELTELRGEDRKNAEKVLETAIKLHRIIMERGGHTPEDKKIYLQYLRLRNQHNVSAEGDKKMAYFLDMMIQKASKGGMTANLIDTANGWEQNPSEKWKVHDGDNLRPEFVEDMLQYNQVVRFLKQHNAGLADGEKLFATQKELQDLLKEVSRNHKKYAVAANRPIDLTGSPTPDQIKTRKKEQNLFDVYKLIADQFRPEVFGFIYKAILFLENKLNEIKIHRIGWEEVPVIPEEPGTPNLDESRNKYAHIRRRLSKFRNADAKMEVGGARENYIKAVRKKVSDDVYNDADVRKLTLTGTDDEKKAARNTIAQKIVKSLLSERESLIKEQSKVHGGWMEKFGERFKVAWRRHWALRLGIGAGLVGIGAIGSSVAAGGAGVMSALVALKAYQSIGRFMAWESGWEALRDNVFGKTARKAKATASDKDKMERLAAYTTLAASKRPRFGAPPAGTTPPAPGQIEAMFASIPTQQGGRAENLWDDNETFLTAEVEKAMETGVNKNEIIKKGLEKAMEREKEFMLEVEKREEWLRSNNIKKKISGVIAAVFLPAAIKGLWNWASGSHPVTEGMRPLSLRDPEGESPVGRRGLDDGSGGHPPVPAPVPDPNIPGPNPPGPGPEPFVSEPPPSSDEFGEPEPTPPQPVHPEPAPVQPVNPSPDQPHAPGPNLPPAKDIEIPVPGTEPVAPTPVTPAPTPTPAPQPGHTPPISAEPDPANPTFPKVEVPGAIPQQGVTPARLVIPWSTPKDPDVGVFQSFRHYLGMTNNEWSQFQSGEGGERGLLNNMHQANPGTSARDIWAPGNQHLIGLNDVKKGESLAISPETTQRLYDIVKGRMTFDEMLKKLRGER